MENAFKIENLNKSYKGFSLEIPNLEIPKGFATALIGENGAGKSTLMNILCGSLLNYKGSVTFFDDSMSDEEKRAKVGYTASSNYFMPHWTIEQVAEVNEMLYYNFNKDKYYKMLEKFAVSSENGIKKSKSVGKLSDGMKMKIMLANVFARDTKCLVLDEPASPLDPLMRDILCQMLREYLTENEGENTVIFSTHNISDMEAVTDYAVIIENGVVVEKGFVEELKEKYVLVKGEKGEVNAASEILYSIQENSFGYEGICLASDIEKMAGFDISVEIPSLNQICVAVLKKYTSLKYN